MKRKKAAGVSIFFLALVSLTWQIMQERREEQKQERLRQQMDKMIYEEGFGMWPGHEDVVRERLKERYVEGFKKAFKANFGSSSFLSIETEEAYGVFVLETFPKWSQYYFNKPWSKLSPEEELRLGAMLGEKILGKGFLQLQAKSPSQALEMQEAIHALMNNNLSRTELSELQSLQETPENQLSERQIKRRVFLQTKAFGNGSERETKIIAEGLNSALLLGLEELRRESEEEFPTKGKGGSRKGAP